MLLNQDGNKKKLIYLASPYSMSGNAVSANPAYLKKRFEDVTQALAIITLKYYKTHIFFGPITHSHPISSLIPDRYNKAWFWLDEVDDYWVCSADELWICCLKDWFKSHGVQHEIELAKKTSTPIKYINPYTGDFVSYDEAINIG